MVGIMWWLGRVPLFAACALLAMSVACREAPAPPAGTQPRTDPLVLPVTRPLPAGSLTLPASWRSVKFAVIGNSGRGTPPQYAVAAQMARVREAFPFSFVLMLGNNIHAQPATHEDYRLKFEEPYRPLLEAGVRFYAVPGTQDDPAQVHYEPFNMQGERYYSFVPRGDLLTRLFTRVEFFAIDSTNLDRGQIRWLDARLGASVADWKIVFLHHPLYTSGRSRLESRGHRWALEPLFVRHGVDAVFSGHEHIYQRARLQQGILYFVSGAAGALRLGEGVPAAHIARSYDDDFHFMLVEIEGDALHFQAITRAGITFDAGTLFKDGEDARQLVEGS
jgi:hypothetical protein